MPGSLEPSDFGLRIASDEVLAEREQLAGRVCAELQRAGLPAQRMPEDHSRRVGAEVWVDKFADEDGGGVFVSWVPDPSLTRAAITLPPDDDEPDMETLHKAAKALADLARRGAQTPALRHNAAVAQHMLNAIIGILTSAGLHAHDSGNDMSPYTVQVESR